MNSVIPHTFLVSAAILLTSGQMLSAADWPQWMGINRDGASAETNLLVNWPADGPKVLWKVKGGDGYSTIAVVGERAYTLVQRDGKEWAICLSVKDGKQLWESVLGPQYKNQYGHGPRSTPTVLGGRVYVQSVTGALVCLNAKTGKEVWNRHLLKEFGAKNITWGLSASPLIVGDLVYGIPGSAKAGVAAFHKDTGKTVWKSGKDKAAYSSPVIVSVGGKKQIIFFNAACVMGTNPKTGKELWRMPWKTEFDCNISTPLRIGDKIFVTSGEKVGCALLQLSASGEPDVVWESRGASSVMINYWATSVYEKAHLYGINGEFSKRLDLRCVDAKTGKLKWSRPNFGLAAVTLAAGHLFIATKAGDLVLVEATPKAYTEKARLRGFLGQNRTAPTISNGRLFLRDRRNIYCLDIRK